MDDSGSENEEEDVFLTRRAWKKKVLRQAPVLSKTPPIRFRSTWDYTPGVTVLMFLAWLVGMFLPLTLLIPDGWRRGDMGLVESGALLFFIVTVPVVSFFCVSQSVFAAFEYDAEQKVRLKDVNELLDIAAKDADSSLYAKRARQLLRKAYKRYVRKEKSSRLQHLFVVAFCACCKPCSRHMYGRGRFLCWDVEIATWTLFLVLMLIPLCIMIPIAYSGVVEGYVVDERLVSILVTTAMVVLIVAYFIRVLVKLVLFLKRGRYFSKATGKKVAKSIYNAYLLNVRASRSRREDVGAENEDGDDQAHRPDDEVNFSKMLSAAVGCLPGWVYKEVFLFWFLFIFPLVFGTSLLYSYSTFGFPDTIVSADSVEETLKISAFLLFVIFLGGLLLFKSIIHREVILSTKDEISQFVMEELGYLRLCKDMGWPIESLGDYPHFSIGEGVHTKGVFYRDVGGYSIILTRFYLNFLIFVVGAIIFVAGLLTKIEPTSQDDALVIAIFVGPLYLFVFYSCIILGGIMPTRRIHGLPWIFLWILLTLIAPIAFGFLIRRYTRNPDEDTIGLFLYIYGPCVFVVTLLLWLWKEFSAFRAWTRSLSVHRIWLDKFSKIMFISGIIGTFAMDIALLVMVSVKTAFLHDTGSAPLNTYQYSGLIMVFAFLGNCFIFGFLFFGTVIGRIPNTEGVSRAIPFGSVLVRWFILLYAWLNMHNAGAHYADLSSLIVQNTSLARFTLVAVVITMILFGWYVAYLYKQYSIKKRFGYFPVEWEYRGGLGRPRGVVEEASRVIEYPTSWILADLEDRGLIDPPAKELLKLYLDKSLSEPDRVSIKNRLVLKCTTQQPSRSELEAMLEEEIRNDVHAARQFNQLIWERREHQILAQDKTKLISHKFAEHKLRDVMQVLNARKEPGERKVEEGNDDDLLLNSSSSDDEDDSEDEENHHHRKSRRHDKVTEEEDKSHSRHQHFWNIADFFRKKPHIHVFEVAKVESVIQHVRVPKTSYTKLGWDPAYRSINYLIFLDTAQKRFLFIGYRIWEIVEVPFEWVLSLTWYPNYASEKDAVRVDIVIQYPPSHSCSIRSKPFTRSNKFYCKSIQEREVLCMEFYRVTCSHGLEPRRIQRDKIRGMFEFDNLGTISQIMVNEDSRKTADDILMEQKELRAQKRRGNKETEKGKKSKDKSKKGKPSIEMSQM